MDWSHRRMKLAGNRKKKQNNKEHTFQEKSLVESFYYLQYYLQYFFISKILFLILGVRKQ